MFCAKQLISLIATLLLVSNCGLWVWNVDCSNNREGAPISLSSLSLGIDGGQSRVKPPRNPMFKVDYPTYSYGAYSYYEVLSDGKRGTRIQESEIGKYKKVISVAPLPVTSYTNLPLDPAIIKSDGATTNAARKHVASPITTLNKENIGKVTAEVGNKIKAAEWDKRSSHSVLLVDAKGLEKTLAPQIKAITDHPDRYYIQESVTQNRQVVQTGEMQKNGEWKWSKPKVDLTRPADVSTKKRLTVFHKNLVTGKNEPVQFTLGTFEKNSVLQFSKTGGGFTVETNAKKTTPIFTLYANVPTKKGPIKYDLHMESIGIPDADFGIIPRVGAQKFDFCLGAQRKRRDLNPALAFPSRAKRGATPCSRTRSKGLNCGDSKKKKRERTLEKQRKLSAIENEPSSSRGKTRAKNRLNLNNVEAPPSPTKSNYMGTVEAKSNKVSQALARGRAVAKGEIIKLIGTGKRGLKSTYKLGANAVKSCLHRANAGITRFGTSNTFKKLSKFSGRLGFAFLLKNFGSAIRHGDAWSIGIMSAMTGSGFVATGLAGIKEPVKTSTKVLAGIGKGLGVLLSLGGAVFDVVNVVNSHRCLSGSRNNTELCVRGEGGCVEEYSICGGKNAMAEVVTSYVQLGLSVVSIGLMFSPAAPLGVLVGIPACGIIAAEKAGHAKQRPTEPCEEQVTVFEPFMDNQVDATTWAPRYFQRWSPNPSERIQNYKPNNFTEDNFFCRPEGPWVDINYASDGPWLRGNSYKCGNALGYKHQEPTRALMALFDLQDGTDVAVGFKNHSNYFVVGSGRKHFVGGDQGDTFSLIGDGVSGWLDGGGGVDSIALGQNSFLGEYVLISLVWDKQMLISNSSASEVQLIGIEGIEGREEVADVIHVACHNTYINGRSGSTSMADLIYVAENSCEDRKSSGQVHIVLGPATSLINYNRRRSKVEYIYNVTLINGTHLHDASLRSTIQIEAGLGLAQHYVLLPLPLHQLSILRTMKIGDGRVIRLQGVGLDFVATFGNSSQVTVATLDEAQFTYMDDTQGTLFFFFNLNNSVVNHVVGAERYMNYFKIQNAYKSITGGALDDTFVFTTDKEVGFLGGGSGGSNTIIISNSLEGHYEIRFTTMEIVFINLMGQLSKTKLAGTFEAVVGREGLADTLFAHCSTKSIDLKQGNVFNLDKVTIHDMRCPHSPRITIVVPPFTWVNNEYRGLANFTYVISASNSTGAVEGRIMNLAPSSHSQHLIRLGHEPRAFRSMTYVPSTHTLRVAANGLSLEINLPTHNFQQNVHLIHNEFTAIQLESSNEKSGLIEPVFVFNLSRNATVNYSSVVGAPNSVNRFHIDRNIGEVVGGAKNDVFHLGPNGRVGRITGTGGNDTIVLFPTGINGANTKYTLDLSSHVNISDRTSSFRAQLSGDFTHLYGPAAAVDSITAACSTQLIHLSEDEESHVRPSAAQNLTRIRIPSNPSPTCSYDVLLHLSTHPGNRLVLNGARRGVFKYVASSYGNEFVVYRVVQNVTTAEELLEFEENVTQLFVLNVTLSEIEDVAADWGSGTVNISFGGRFSTFQIKHVLSEQSLSPLQLFHDPDKMDAVQNNTLPGFEYNFLTKDGYELTVNHLGGINALTTMDGPMDADKVFDVIQNHVVLANDLGMTIIVSVLGDGNAQAQFIQIGGDDEMDFLINQDSAESHLVGNLMGERNVFYVAPTLNNLPIHVYLPTSTSFPNNGRLNVLQFSSLYDRRPPELDPALYKPNIYIPTIEERDGDLVITAEYNPDPSFIPSKNESRSERQESNTPEERRKETVVFVNGVEDYERLEVKLFSILYEIDSDWVRLEQNLNQNNADKNDWLQESRVWTLRPQQLHFEQSPSTELQDEYKYPTEDFESESDKEFEENDHSHQNRTDNESLQGDEGSDQAGLKTEKVGKIRRKRSARKVTQDVVAILSYADIMEYRVAGMSLELPAHLTSKENVFTSGDDILLTNNLAKPNSNLYRKLTSPSDSPDDADTDADDDDDDDDDADEPAGASIILVGMKRAIEVNNVTLAFTLKNFSNSTQNETMFQLTFENITTALPDVVVAQEEFTQAHAHFENVLGEVQSITKNIQSDFDAKTNASEGVEAAQLEFISYYSNFTSYFDVVHKKEGALHFWHYWVHRSRATKALEGVRAGYMHFKESHCSVEHAYSAFKGAEQRYNSSVEKFSGAQKGMEMEGIDFQSSYENLQLAEHELTDAKSNFRRSSDHFWVAIGNVKESENTLLSAYELYKRVLEDQDSSAMQYFEIFGAALLLFTLIVIVLTPLCFLALYFCSKYFVNRRLKGTHRIPSQDPKPYRSQTCEIELQSVAEKRLLCEQSQTLDSSNSVPLLYKGICTEDENT